jgi:hypothetical protein
VLAKRTQCNRWILAESDPTQNFYKNYQIHQDDRPACTLSQP